jgi:hypothetical protein
MISASIAKSAMGFRLGRRLSKLIPSVSIARFPVNEGYVGDVAEIYVSPNGRPMPIASRA